MKKIGCLACVLFLFLTACSSSAHLVIKNAENYEITIEFLPDKILENTITKLSDNSNTGHALFTRAELTKALEPQGITVTSFQLIGMTGFKLSCGVPARNPLVSELIRYNIEKRHIQFMITQKIVRKILALLPEGSKEFIDMLMAPIFTEEPMNTDEYALLIASTYGNKLASSLKKSVFTLIVDSPYKAAYSTIQPLGIVSRQDYRTVIKIPLPDLLCTADAFVIDIKGN